MDTNSVTNGSTNLYFDQASVINASPSADILDGTGNLTASDSLSSAFGKLEAKKKLYLAQSPTVTLAQIQLH